VSFSVSGRQVRRGEVEALLDKGRAVGAKPLREYMEVQGYGTAARWVYAHAVDPGDWRTDALVSLYEVRQVHSLAMSPVWQVAPHPEATDREGPGLFREHDIQPFGGGMTPPSWPLVAARVQDWIDEATRPQTGTAVRAACC
jgi:hypothetical protein